MLLFWFLTDLFCSKLVLTVLLLGPALLLAGWEGRGSRLMSSGPREVDMVYVGSAVLDKVEYTTL